MRRNYLFRRVKLRPALNLKCNSKIWVIIKPLSEMVLVDFLYIFFCLRNICWNLPKVVTDISFQFWGYYKWRNDWRIGFWVSNVSFFENWNWTWSFKLELKIMVDKNCWGNLMFMPETWLWSSFNFKASPATGS